MDHHDSDTRNRAPQPVPTDDWRPLLLIMFAVLAVIAGLAVPLEVWLTGVMVLALAVVGGLFGIALAVSIFTGLGVICRDDDPAPAPAAYLTGRIVPRQRRSVR